MNARLEGINATAPQSAYSWLLHQNMGISKQSPIPQQHNPNRKRVRHRPNRRLRSQTLLSSANNDLLRHTPRSYNEAVSSPLHSSGANLDSYGSMLLAKEETAESRDRRMFGGLDDDTESARALRGPMLDVVLGLFNGLDYDDSKMS